MQAQKSYFSECIKNSVAHEMPEYAYIFDLPREKRALDPLAKELCGKASDHMPPCYFTHGDASIMSEFGFFQCWPVVSFSILLHIMPVTVYSLLYSASVSFSTVTGRMAKGIHAPRVTPLGFIP